MSGSALAMKLRLDLSVLARRHQVLSVIPPHLPLEKPSPRPIVISGIASSGTIDNERMKFRPWSLNFLPWRPPALLFRHKEPAGEITHIGYDKRGRVIITARVDHPEARRCNGLSVAATIERYELRDVDDSANFHALILQATLDEVSLTPTPCCADCLVTSRLPANPNNEFFDLARDGVNKCIEIVELLQQLSSRAPEQAVAHPIGIPRGPAADPSEFSEGSAAAKCAHAPLLKAQQAAEPYRQTEFGRLVAQLEARSSP